jgi:hypothetical protein
VVYFYTLIEFDHMVKILTGFDMDKDSTFNHLLHFALSKMQVKAYAYMFRIYRKRKGITHDANRIND